MLNRAGRHVALRPVTPADYPYIYALETRLEVASHWRLMGRTASPEQMLATLWDGVLALYMVVRRNNGSPCGLVVLYAPDFRHRSAFVAALADGATEGSGLVIEGLALLVTEAFRSFDLRKVYAEAVDSATAAYRSGLGRYFREEGRLVDHYYIDGGYQDKVMMAIYREEWLEVIGTYPWLELAPTPAGNQEHIPATEAATGGGSFTVFAENVRRALRIQEDQVLTPATALSEDLGLDSLGVIELACFVETLCNRDFPEDLIASWRTLGDAYAPTE